MHSTPWAYRAVSFKPDDDSGRNNRAILTVRLTSRRDIFNSLPWPPDVFITVTPAFGKVLCNYFIEVSTRHHPRKLPYWCRGCQRPGIKPADIQICIDSLFFPHHRIIRWLRGCPWIADSNSQDFKTTPTSAAWSLGSIGSPLSKPQKEKRPKVAINYMNILPNHYMRVFHPEPGSEHPSIRTSDCDNRTVLSSRQSWFQVLNQDCKICQGLFWGQVVQVFVVLQTNEK